MSMALEGTKVVDLSRGAAVHMCARHLADYGADVILIENAATGDSLRSLQAGHAGGPAGIPADIPYGWETFNRNKMGLAIDLTKTAGRDIVHRLVKDADVLLTDLRPPERDRFHMTYETLNAINPRLVYGSLTGHGMNGPDNDAPAYQTTAYFARSGVSSMLMTTGGGRPTPRTAFGDTVAGMILAFGTMTALYARDREGGLDAGQQVDTSLLFAGIYQLSFDMAGALATHGREAATSAPPAPSAERTKEMEEMVKIVTETRAAVRRALVFQRERCANAMDNTYETGDGRSICFSCLDADRYWAKFCKLIDREDLENDPKFASIESREANRKELYNIVKDIFLAKTLEDWLPLIKAFPASPIQAPVHVIDDPQTAANDFFVPFDHPNYGTMRIIASPVNLSKTPATIRSPAPEFSQHTEEILLEEGYGWDEIAELKEQGVIPV